MTFGIAIALIEVGSGVGQVDEGHALLLGQLLRVVGIIHGMVVGCQFWTVNRTVLCQHLVAVAQVVATVALDF